MLIHLVAHVCPLLGTFERLQLKQKKIQTKTMKKHTIIKNKFKCGITCDKSGSQQPFKKVNNVNV